MPAGRDRDGLSMSPPRRNPQESPGVAPARGGATRQSPGWGIRQRLSALAVALVGATLLLGVLFLTNLLNYSLTHQLIASVANEAAVVAQSVAGGGPEEIFEVEFTDAYRVQLLGAGGELIHTSPPAAATAPFSSLRPTAGEQLSEGASWWWLPWQDDLPQLVVAQGTVHDGQHYVVLVGASQTSQQQTVSTAALVLVATAPFLLLGVALATWWLVGLTLRPVDNIRTRVERISGANLDDRVPVPSTRDEIQALASTMNEMLDRLEDAQDRQRRFVSDASHELRSPLASLAGALEIAQQEDDPRTWRELAPVMRSEAARMGDLLQGMLLLSRADDRGVPLDLRETDLDDLVNEEVLRLRTTTGLDVRRQVVAVRMSGDREKLAQMLRNLADNAARHARTTVSFAVHSDGPDAVVSVADDGAGIPESDRKRIFGRFVRLDESRTRDTGGSGLGLAIVREIVHAHGGTVEAGTSDELGGAEVRVRLPLGGPSRT